MSFDFRAMVYFSRAEQRPPLEAFFFNIKEKVNLYEQHSIITTDLYRKEYRDINDGLSTKYQLFHEEANKRYKELMEMEEYDDYARHESNLDEVQRSWAEEIERLATQFSQMADNFNKASLVVLYGLLESELRNLCELLKAEFEKRIGLEHLNEKNYLESILSYLELVIEIPVQDIQSFVSRFRDVQYLRNRIVHNGAEFPKFEANKDLERIIRESKKHLVLIDATRATHVALRIQRVEYVLGYYDLLISFFGKLLWLLDKKTGYQLLKRRISFLFGFSAPKKSTIEVNIEAIEDIKKGKLIRCKINFKHKNQKSTVLNGCIMLTTNPKDKLHIIDQTEPKAPRLQRLLEYLNHFPEILIHDTFAFFYLHEVHMRLK